VRTVSLRSPTLGTKFFARMARKTKNAAISATKTVAHDAATAARATQHSVLRPLAHGVATGARAVGHIAMEAERLIQRVVRRELKKFLVGKIGSGGAVHGADVPGLDRSTAKTTLTPTAIAAMTAVGAAAGAPIVGVGAAAGGSVGAAVATTLTPVLIDQIFDAMAKGKKAGKTPEQIKAELDAAALADNNLATGKPESEISPVLMIGGAVGIGFLLYILLRRK
jgi:hypothetical protein